MKETSGEDLIKTYTFMEFSIKRKLTLYCKELILFRVLARPLPEKAGMWGPSKRLFL